MLPVYANAALLHDSGVTPTHWVNTDENFQEAGFFPYPALFPADITSVAIYVRNTSTSTQNIDLYYYMNSSAGTYFDTNYNPQPIPAGFEGFVSWNIPLAAQSIGTVAGIGDIEFFVNTPSDVGVEMGYTPSDVDPLSEDFLSGGDAAFRFFEPDPPPPETTFHSDYVQQQQAGFASTTGFTMQAGVGFASENFLMLILGSGLAMLMELIWWIIGIVIIYLIIRFSYRAWSGMGVTKEKPTPKYRPPKQRPKNSKKKRERKKGHRHKKRG